MVITSPNYKEVYCTGISILRYAEHDYDRFAFTIYDYLLKRTDLPAKLALSSNRRICMTFFAIGFKKEVESSKKNDKVTFRIGKHSNRLYCIEIPGPERNLHEHANWSLSSVMLEKVFDTLAKRPGAIRCTANYEVAKKILSKRGKELSKEVTA